MNVRETLERRAALLSVDSIVLAGPVRPGDVLVVEGTVETWGQETAVLSGRAFVAGRLVLTATNIMCSLIPAEDLEDSSAVSRMHRQLLRDVPRNAA